LGSQLDLIIALQKIDAEVIRINNRKKILPGELAKLDETFNTYCIDVEKDKKNQEELYKTHKEKEEKLKRGFENLKKAKDRLSDVKTNKEYQAMLKEIESIELNNGAMEDEILVIMDKLDQVRKLVKIREQELDEHRRDYEFRKHQIQQELATMEAEISDYLDKGLMLRERIEPDLLKRYETIKNRSNGLAVVAAWKEICAGCHMNIPPQMYIELQRDININYCPHCNRIIYWEDKDKKGLAM